MEGKYIIFKKLKYLVGNFEDKEEEYLCVMVWSWDLNFKMIGYSLSHSFTSIFFSFEKEKREELCSHTSQDKYFI